MPRFAILDHDHPYQHWDFLLESGDILRAWRLAREPNRSDTILAEALANHRPYYLDYEGPVGGGRGRVRRWDGGTFAWEADTDDEVRVRLDGTSIRGSVVLKRASDSHWLWEWL